MTMPSDVAEKITAALTNLKLSRRGRRIWEHLLLILLVLVIVVPVIAGLCTDAMADRVVKLGPHVTFVCFVLGGVISGLKTMGHRENMQTLKGPG